VAQRPDFSLLIGPEELLPDAVLLGAHGGVCGGANLAPRLYVDLYQAASVGALERVRALQARVLRLTATIYHVGPSAFAFLQGLKCALSCLGLCTDVLAEPFQRFGPVEREKIHHALVELQLAPGS